MRSPRRSTSATAPLPTRCHRRSTRCSPRALTVLGGRRWVREMGVRLVNAMEAKHAHSNKQALPLHRSVTGDVIEIILLPGLFVERPALHN